jgi:hypothetical protein
VLFDVILLAHFAAICEPVGALQVSIQVSVFCKPVSFDSRHCSW